MSEYVRKLTKIKALVNSATWVKDDDWVPEGAHISDDEESFYSSVCPLAESEGEIF